MTPPRPKIAWRKVANSSSFNTAALIFIIGVLVTCGFAAYAYYYKTETQALFLKKQATEKLFILQNKIDKHISLLNALEGYFQGSDFVTREEFHAFSTALNLRTEHFRGIFWSPKILFKAGQGNQVALAKWGLKGADLKQLDYGIDETAKDRAIFPIVYEGHFTSNTFEHGFDIASHADIAPVLQKAIETARPTATRRLELEGEEPKIFILAPVYKTGTPSQELQDRKDNLYGFVGTKIYLTDIINFNIDDADVYVLDNGFDKDAQSAMLYAKQSPTSRTHPDVRDVIANPLWQGTVAIADRSWTIMVSEPGSVMQDRIAASVNSTLLWGMLLSALISTLMGYKLAREHRLLSDNQQLKEALADIRELNKKVYDLALIAQHTKDIVIITDDAGYIEWVNRPFQDLTGYTLEEALGKKPGPLLQGSETDPQTIQALSTAIAEQEQIDVEILNYSKTGETYWLAISIYPVEDESGKVVKFAAVERDITQRKKTDEELRRHRDHLQELVEEKMEEAERQTREYLEQKNLLNQVLDHMPLNVFAKDVKNDYKYIIINKEAEHFYGRPAAEVLGKSDFDFFPKAQSESFRHKDVEAMQNGKVIYIEQEPITTPSRTIIARTIKVPIFDQDGAPAILLGISEDVTDRIMAQEELKVAKDAAERANTAKSDFLANMSHEIRTPMSGIIGLTRLLVDTDLDADQKQSVEAILRSGESLLFLLNDILDFSKIEAGELALEDVPFNINTGMKHIVDLLSPLASKKGLALNYSFDDPAHAHVSGDMARIGQIVTNLVGNAIKFTQKGQVTLSVSAVERIKEDDILYNILIEDTGIGIPKDVQGQLFKKFSQGDMSTSRKFGGTGLGLAISQDLAGLMGGKITFTSEQGKGSKFTVVIPLKKAKAEIIRDRRMQWSQGSYGAPEALARKRILVVDDHPVNMLFARKLLKKIGFVTVDEAVHGIEALEKIKAAATGYDLILMDCQMPEMDGFATTRRIREREEANNLPRVPIIAMTANALEGDRDLCMEAGMDDYISKPVNPDKLHAVISAWLNYTRDVAALDPEAPVVSDTSEAAINMDHLVLFTEGDPKQEKLISDLFVWSAADSLKKMRAALEGGQNVLWMGACHKLKGSAAQIGAERLSAACQQAEQAFEALPAEKQILLVRMELRLQEVEDFFTWRQAASA